MMKLSDLFKISALDYDLLSKSLETLPLEIRTHLTKMILNHKFVTDYKQLIIRLQERSYVGIFGYNSLIPADTNALHVVAGSQVPNESSPLSEESTENESAEQIDETEDLDSEEENQATLPRGKKSKLPRGTVVPLELFPEQKICPCCHEQMARCSTRSKTVVFAQPLLHTKTFEQETVRCLKCDSGEKASLPIEATETCGRYHFSAVASLAALRYQYGGASYRVEAMSANLGLRISDSTQWAMFEEAAGRLLPFVNFLKKYSANAKVVRTDDTHNLILSIEEQQEAAIQNGQNPNLIRSGIHNRSVQRLWMHLWFPFLVIGEYKKSMKISFCNFA